ncbi:hypothetical protein D3C74_312190 [compost metagenome]
MKQQRFFHIRHQIDFVVGDILQVFVFFLRLHVRLRSLALFEAFCKLRLYDLLQRL